MFRRRRDRMVRAVEAVMAADGVSRAAAFATLARRSGPYQHNLLAQALNESFLEQGQDHPVRYADPASAD